MFSDPISGNAERTSPVTTWKPRGLPGSVISRCSHIWHAGYPHVDPPTAEWHPFGHQPRPLPRAFRQRAVGADDPMPRHRWILASVKHRACRPRCSRRHVPISAHEANRRRAHTGKDAIGVHV
jgi:hypothetical protein